MTGHHRSARWAGKFAVATAGIGRSLRSEDSFRVHVPATLAVIAAAGYLGVEPWRWVALTLAIAAVWSAELFNTAIEGLVRTLRPTHDERIGAALDAAAGAVLVVAIAAAVVGLITLGPPAWEMIDARFRDPV